MNSGNHRKDAEEDLVPRQPSDWSSVSEIKRQEHHGEWYSFEYVFHLENKWTGYHDVANWLKEKGLHIDQYHEVNQILTDGSAIISLRYEIDSNGDGVLKVRGQREAFHYHSDLIEVLKEDESPVQYKESNITGDMTSVIFGTPYPWRFEFIYDPEESYAYADTAIQQWINEQEVVKFLDENKFKEPGDEHPTFIRIREAPDGKPILMLEGYSTEGLELIDLLTDKESPFEFRRRYRVGRNLKKEEI